MLASHLSLYPKLCNSRTGSLLVLVVLVLSFELTSPSWSREQYQMTRPAGPVPSQPIGSSSPKALAGLVPQVTPDFWNAYAANRIESGTLILGELQQDLASNKSRAGENFEIAITRPLVINGREMIAAGSKIIGKVIMAVPAKQLRYGNPGNLQVSLDALVLPDGRRLALYGFIDRNKSLEFAEAPKIKPAGQQLSDWGQSLKSFMGSFTSGIGVSLNRQDRGAEFKLAKGEVVEVRLNRPLDILPLPVDSPAGNFANLPSPGGAVQIPSVPGIINTPGSQVLPANAPIEPLSLPTTQSSEPF